jgi:hypothetical protein
MCRIAGLQARRGASPPQERSGAAAGRGAAAAGRCWRDARAGFWWAPPVGGGGAPCCRRGRSTTAAETLTGCRGVRVAGWRRGAALAGLPPGALTESTMAKRSGGYARKSPAGAWGALRLLLPPPQQIESRAWASSDP